MRELERNFPHPHTSQPARAGVSVVGRGRLGSALAASLSDAGYVVDGPLGRGQEPREEVVLLCVPDSEIPAAAAAVAGRARIVGHTSGATPLTALEPAGGAQAFGLHPLQTVTADRPARFERCGCAVAG